MPFLNQSFHRTATLPLWKGYCLARSMPKQVECEMVVAIETFLAQRLAAEHAIWAAIFLRPADLPVLDLVPRRLRRPALGAGGNTADRLCIGADVAIRSGGRCSDR